MVLASFVMASRDYTLPEAPVYNAEEIRKIQDSDPVRASTIVNPVVERLIENTHAVKLQLRGDGVDGIGQLRDGLQGGVSGHHSLVCGQPGTGCILGGLLRGPEGAFRFVIGVLGHARGGRGRHQDHVLQAEGCGRQLHL